ncbi:hypothetical protein NQ315_003174 [Exocentrus adspersus]|uniref:Secreted protein n=1 Tax=Exocentrus adspersus TaxID=1586481 RepID=A0AAV8W5C8_9CUCU|nr:hypothetical protein NQ315_003174 [Exocentrus adspersus]
MKFLNLSFICLVLLVARIQCYNDDSSNDKNSVLLKLTTAGMKIIEAITDVSEDLIITTFTSVISGESNIEDVLKYVEKYAINATWSFIVDQLNAMEEGASDTRKAMIECVKEEGPKLTEILFDASNQLSNCYVQQSVTILDGFIPMVNLSQALNEQMKSFTNDLEACVDVEDVQTCATKVFDSIIETMKSFLIKIQAEAEVVDAIVTKFKKLTQLCQDEASDKLVKGINQTSTEKNAEKQLQKDYKLEWPR